MRARPGTNKEESPPQPADDSRVRLDLWIPSIVLVGAFLRSYRLGDQIIWGDEVWAVLAATQHGFGWLLSHVQIDLGTDLVDYGPALGSYVRAIFMTVGVSEWTLRIPMLLFGIALPLLLARGLRVWLASPTVILATALVALSPILVLYSRFARPYGIIAFFEVAAVLALVRGLRGEAMRPLVLHAFFSALAIYLNLSSGVFLASLWIAALVWVVLDRAPRETRRRRVVRLVVSGAGAGIAALFLLLPAMGSLTGAVSDRAGRGQTSLEFLLYALHLAIGTPSRVLLLLILGLVMAGLVHLFRRSRATAAAALCLLVLPSLLLLVVRPHRIDQPMVFVRYQVGTVVLALVLTAVGVMAMVHYLRDALRLGKGASRGSFASAASGLVAVLYVTGPLPSTHLRVNDFATMDLVLFAERHPDRGPDTIPSFYTDVVPEGPPGAVVETPWTVPFMRVIRRYQRVHGRRTYFATDGLMTSEPGLDFRKMIPYDFERVEEKDTAWLVVHLDPQGEFGMKPAPEPQLATIARIAAERYGPPEYRDRWIAAYRIRLEPESGSDGGPGIDSEEHP